MTDNLEESGMSSDIESQWNEALSEQKESGAKKPEESVRPASFNQLKQESAGPIGNIDMILDIPVTISVEVGRTKIIVKDLLHLSQGSVVELDKLAGEPMEILVNGRLIAKGEAVVVNEKFGIKLTDIVSAAERINNLK